MTGHAWDAFPACLFFRLPARPTGPGPEQHIRPRVGQENQSEEAPGPFGGISGPTS